MTSAVFAYQWVRHDLATETDTEIEGATGQTYDVAAEDGGKALKVRVTFTDDAGNEESLTSYAVIASPSLRRTESLTTKTTTTGAHGERPRRAAVPRRERRVHLRAAVQRGAGGRLQLHDGAGSRPHSDRWLGEQRAEAGAGQGRPVGDNRYAVLGRRRVHNAECHHRLLRRERHLQC